MSRWNIVRNGWPSLLRGRPAAQQRGASSQRSLTDARQGLEGNHGGNHFQARHDRGSAVRRPVQNPWDSANEDVSTGGGCRSLLPNDRGQRARRPRHRPRRWRPLLRSVAEAWIQGRLVRGRPLSPMTRQGYEGILRRHLDPEFGQSKLRAITSDSVRAWNARVTLSSGPDAQRRAIGCCGPSSTRQSQTTCSLAILVESKARVPNTRRSVRCSTSPR